MSHFTEGSVVMPINERLGKKYKVMRMVKTESIKYVYFIQIFLLPSFILKVPISGRGIPQSYWRFRFRSPQQSEYHNKVSQMKFLVSQHMSK